MRAASLSPTSLGTGDGPELIETNSVVTAPGWIEILSLVSVSYPALSTTSW
jgi:hypothetical protein